MGLKSARLRPDSAIIFDTSTIHCDRAGCETEVLFARVHRDRPADRAGGRDRAIGRDRRAGVRAVLQFRRLRRSAAAAARNAVAAAGSAAISSRHFSSSSSPSRRRVQDFSKAPPPEKRDDRAGAQRAGARRRHGRLARLRPRGRLCRTARHGRDPQAQDRLRPDQISAQGRARPIGPPPPRAFSPPRSRTPSSSCSGINDRMAIREPVVEKPDRSIRQERPTRRTPAPSRRPSRADAKPGAQAGRRNRYCRQARATNRPIPNCPRTMPPTMTMRRRPPRRKRARVRRTASMNFARSAGSSSTPRRSKR